MWGWTLSGSDSFGRKRGRDIANLKHSQRPNLEEPFPAQKIMMILFPQILWEPFKMLRQLKRGVCSVYPPPFQQFDSIWQYFALLVRICECVCIFILLKHLKTSFRH